MVASPSKSDGRSQKAVLGIPTVALVETALLLGAALLFDALFLDGTRFRAWSQHPFWIPVLLVAVQYGTNAGLVAATAGTLALLAGNIPPQAVFEDRFIWFSGIVRLPLLWFVVTVVLGELRMRQIREKKALREQFGEASRREAVLTEAYQRLNEVRMGSKPGWQVKYEPR